MKHPQQFVGRLPDPFHKVVNKIHVFLMPPRSSGRCSPNPSLLLSCVAYPNILDGVKEVGPFGSILHSWEARCSFTHSQYPPPPRE